MKVADDLKKLMVKAKIEKEQATQYELMLGQEEENAKQAEQEISELQKTKRELEQHKQNIENRVLEITQEVNQFIFQLMKLEKSNRENTPQEVQRITFKYKDEEKKLELQSKTRQK